MLLLVKCPSPLPNCFLSPKWSDRPLSFFQVLVKVCPLRSLSLGPHSLWEPKLDTGDLGCWYVPNVGGIQQLSECPRTRHSCVHISVASTRPRGPRGPSGKKRREKKRSHYNNNYIIAWLTHAKMHLMCSYNTLKCKPIQFFLDTFQTPLAILDLETTTMILSSLFQ